MTTPSSVLGTAAHVILFLFRLPFFVTYSTAYFLILHHLPLPTVIHKLLLWLLLAIPGVWWVDLQLDGVKRGDLSKQPASRMPHPRSVIAANFTSPLDALYLAAVFDPVFVVAHPRSRKVRRVGLLRAVLAALTHTPQFSDPPTPSSSSEEYTSLRDLLHRHPNRVIAVFPECGTTNGKGILPLSPCLLSPPAETAIFPLSLRYTPPDVTTPVPGPKACLSFLWKLLGRPSHCIRVRIAEAQHNTTVAVNGGEPTAASTGGHQIDDGQEPTAEEQKMLDRIGEALARLGRAKRVGLTLVEKKEFVKLWNKGKK